MSSKQNIKIGNSWFGISSDKFKLGGRWFDVSKKFYRAHNKWFDVSTSSFKPYLVEIVEPNETRQYEFETFNDVKRFFVDFNEPSSYELAIYERNENGN